MTATNLTVPLILDITRTHSTLSFPPQHTSSQQQYSTTTIPPHDSSLPTNTSTTLLLYALVPAVLMSLVITVCVISVTSVLCCKRYSKKTLQGTSYINMYNLTKCYRFQQGAYIITLCPVSVYPMQSKSLRMYI